MIQPLKTSAKYYVIIIICFICSIILLLSTPILTKLIGILFAGVGISFSLNLIWIYLRTGDLSHEALNVNQYRNLAINLPYNRVFDLCTDSLKQIPEITINTSDRNNGIIIAFYPLSTWLKMDGVSPYTEDKISFKIKEISSHHIHVYISCEPNLSVKVIEGRFDGGRNYCTIEKIDIFLKQRQIPDLVIPIIEQENCPICGKK